PLSLHDALPISFTKTVASPDASGHVRSLHLAHCIIQQVARRGVVPTSPSARSRSSAHQPKQQEPGCEYDHYGEGAGKWSIANRRGLGQVFIGQRHVEIPVEHLIPALGSGV